MRNKPDQWTPEWRKQVLLAYDEMLELMSWLQNADAVKRQRYDHIEREKEWEHCVNLVMALHPAVKLFLEWIACDVS